MVDPSLQKQWASTAEWLRNAKSYLRTSELSNEPLAQFENYLSHNELELALDSLSDAGDFLPQSARFWDCLCQAAMSMKLSTHVASLSARWASVAVPSHANESEANQPANSTK